jgi:hypothetical protein
MNQFEPVPNQSLVQCEPVQAVQFTNLNQFIIEPLTSLTGVLKHAVKHMIYVPTTVTRVTAGDLQLK